MRASWNKETKLIMGSENDITEKALVRVRGVMKSGQVEVAQLVILTRSAQIVETE
jgi:hypothetical protein